MTSDELRELLDDLKDEYGVLDAATPHDWVDAVVERSMRSGHIEFSDTIIGRGGQVLEAPDHDGQVCILHESGMRLYVPRDVVPEWIDVKEELPV